MQFKVVMYSSSSSSTDSVMNLINAPVNKYEVLPPTVWDTLWDFGDPSNDGIPACASRDLATIQGGTSCPAATPPPDPHPAADPAAPGPYTFYVQWVVMPTDTVRGTCPAANAAIVTSLATMMQGDFASFPGLTTTPVVTVEDTSTRVSVRRGVLLDIA